MRILNKALAAFGVLLAISFLGHSAQAQTGCAAVGTVPGIIYGQNGSTSACTDAYVDPSTHELYVKGSFTPSGTSNVVINPSATVGITTQSCSAACASTLVSGAHAAYGISGSATVTGWILVYDATTCSANGTVTPKKAYAYTVANSTIGISWADIPMVNSTGIAVCFSTTGPYTATASTTAFLSVDYK